MKKNSPFPAVAIAAGLVLSAGGEVRSGPGSAGAGGLSVRGVEMPQAGIPSGHEERLRLAQVWYETLTAARPELQIHYREVPDEKNGLLQLLEASENLHLVEKREPDDKRAYSARLKPPELAAMLSGKGPWNAELATAWLAGNETMLARMEEIGLMPERSCRGVDWEKLPGVTDELDAVADMLAVKARLAEERGDREAGQRSVAALRGLVQHLQGCEAPSLRAMEVALGLNNRLVTAAGWLANGMATREDILLWMEEMSALPAPDPAAVLRGEWNLYAPKVFLPGALGEKVYSDPASSEDPHPDIAAGAWADVFTAEVKDAEGLAPRPLVARSESKEAVPGIADLPAGLAPYSRGKIIQVTGVIDRMLADVMLMHSRVSQQMAAVAAGVGVEPAKEPLTGLPYRIDRKAGEVQMPETDLFRGMAAMRIPGSKKNAPAAPEK